MSGQKVTCVIDSSTSTTEQNVNVLVTVSREGGPSQMAMAEYRFLNPVIDSVFPLFGPASGGTMVVVTGTNLNTGNVEQTRVQFVQSGNSVMKREAILTAGNCTVV